MARLFRDPQLEKELLLSGLHPTAAEAVFADLCVYLKAPIEAIAEEYWRYRRNDDVLAQAEVAQATREETILDYYRKTPHYLYELSYWEASREKQAWLEVLLRTFRKFGSRRIVDFGGGVGGVGVFLGKRGLECGHVDVPGKTREYAAWRFKRHGLNVAVLDGTQPQQWPKAEADAVIAWDVLEHLFDLEASVRNIAGLLRPGGLFLSLSTFADEHGEHEHIHLAKHACYHDIQKFNAMICSAGFTFMGQLKPDRLSRILRQCGLRHAVAGARIAPKLKHGGNFLAHRRAA